MIDERLSPHFTLREMCRTEVRNVDNTPPQDVVYRLTQLCNLVLEPIRARFGALYVNSGWRCKTLNHIIGGAPDSAHTYGCAADVVPFEDVDLADVVRWVAASSLLFDQIIEEHSRTSDWLHIGTLRPGHETLPRRQALVMRDGIYTPFTV